MNLARLSNIDDELDRFGVEPARVERVRARAREEHLALEEADAALSALTGGVETTLPTEGVPTGVVAKPGSWERRSDRAAPGSGLVEIDPASIDDSLIPPALTAPPPASGDEDAVVIPRMSRPLDVSDDDSMDTGRSSIEISIEPSEPALFDDDEGTEVHGRDVGLAAQVMAPSALELELEGEPMDLPSSTTQSSAKFSVPHDTSHPSPKSVIPPPPPSADLDAELASILADELQPPPGSPGADDPGELEPEATALFSADMFGASEEPSLAQLISRPPPPDPEASVEGDSLEIEIDDDVLVYEAEPAPAPPASAGTRPPPPPARSAPPPAKPGFLGRLLNRK